MAGFLSWQISMQKQLEAKWRLQVYGIVRGEGGGERPIPLLFLLSHYPETIAYQCHKCSQLHIIADFHTFTAAPSSRADRMRGEMLICEEIFELILMTFPEWEWEFLLFTVVFGILLLFYSRTFSEQSTMNYLVLWSATWWWTERERNSRKTWGRKKGVVGRCCLLCSRMLGCTHSV